MDTPCAHFPGESGHTGRNQSLDGVALRTLIAAERPQERLERLGAGALADAELLAMILRSGTRGRDVLGVATGLLCEAGSLASLFRWKEPDFRRVRGIGRIKALQLVAVAEVARRALEQRRGEDPLLNTAASVAEHLGPVAAGLDIEKFWVLCLNRRNRLLRRVEITSGTATCTLAHPREVFRAAIRESAAAIVCAHNHPSGVMPHPVLCRMPGARSSEMLRLDAA